jgi:hypothetical protein
VLHEFIFFALLVASFIDDDSRPDDWAELPHLLSTPSDQGPFSPKIPGARCFRGTCYSTTLHVVFFSRTRRYRIKIRCNYRISYMQGMGLRVMTLVPSAVYRLSLVLNNSSMKTNCIHN